MSIVEKYISREIFKYFGFVLAGVIVLYLVVDFFDRIDNFIDAELPLGRIFNYLQLQIPLIIARVMPVGLLLAILLTLGLMNRGNEILALKSCGLSPRAFFRPMLAIGLVGSLVLLLLNEIVVPITFSKANRIWEVEVQKHAAVTTRQKNIWIRGFRSITFISYFNPKTLEISGVTLNVFDEHFQLIRRVDAARGKFAQGGWQLFEIMEQRYDSDAGSYKVNFQDSRKEKLDFEPADLKRAAKKSEEMNILELFEYIEAVESEGYDATPYRVDLYAKFALPAACIILCMIAAGIVLHRTHHFNLAVGIAVGLGIVFLYWVLYSFCLSLGYGGILPPLIAAWIANAVFACVGIYALVSIG